MMFDVVKDLIFWDSEFAKKNHLENDKKVRKNVRANETYDVNYSKSYFPLSTISLK